MAQEFSAGLVVFRRKPNFFQYLLLQASKGKNHWTPPKGHLDEGENFLDAAKRETEEEANILEHRDYEIIDDNFKIEIEYPVQKKQSIKLKKVVYWVAELKDPFTLIELSDEHIDFKWADYTEAMKLIEHEETTSVIKQAESFLKSVLN